MGRRIVESVATSGWADALERDDLLAATRAARPTPDDLVRPPSHADCRRDYQRPERRTFHRTRHPR